MEKKLKHELIELACKYNNEREYEKRNDVIEFINRHCQREGIKDIYIIIKDTYIRDLYKEKNFLTRKINTAESTDRDILEKWVNQIMRDIQRYIEKNEDNF